jgi:antitoxin component YwqK of YwqJK toxin-antitoxin module
MEENWQGGKQDGVTTLWWANGQKSGDLYFENGQRQGKHTMWHENSRGPDSDISINGDLHVSRKHGEFLSINNEIHYQDLHATNKSTVNNQLITNIVKLKNGDKLVLGRTTFIYEKIENTNIVTD